MQPTVTKEKDLTYNAYLKVPELLALQHPLSKPQHHDEMLFIVIHQTYELWFKLMLHELESVQDLLERDDVFTAHHLLKRVNAIWHVLVPQIHILETMAPEDFLKFRDHLNPASGFQSLQYRELEFFVGARDERFFRFFQHRPEMLAQLQKRMQQKSLWTSYEDMMRRRFKTDLKESLKAMVAQREQHFPVYLLTDAMVEFDQQIGLWREHHVRVVERIIGHKMGTGGSSGVDYLKTTTAKKCFQPLWDFRTDLNVATDAQSKGNTTNGQSYRTRIYSPIPVHNWRTGLLRFTHRVHI